MSANVTITRHDEGGSGEYHAHVAGSDLVGRLVWVQNGAGRVAEHTLVPEAIGGRGVAGKLVEAMVADAKAQGFHIVPQCSYVAVWARRHPEEQAAFA